MTQPSPALDDQIQTLSSIGIRGVGGAVLGAPAQLLAVGQVGEVVDGHAGGGQRQSPPLCGSGGCYGKERPLPRRGVRGQDGVGAAVASAGLSDALDRVNRTGGEVETMKDLHDGPGRSADRRLRSLWRAGQGRVEGAGIRQAAGEQREASAQLSQLTGKGRRVLVRRAQSAVRDAAPGSAVACGVGDARVDVPAVGSGDGFSAEFLRVQVNTLLIRAGVPVDEVAAILAPGWLGGA